MRKWFLYVEKSFEKSYPEGHIIAYNKPNPYCAKGERRDMLVLNVKTKQEKVVAKVIGLGYADFKNERDLKKRVWEVLARKIKEVS